MVKEEYLTDHGFHLFYTDALNNVEKWMDGDFEQQPIIKEIDIKQNTCRIYLRDFVVETKEQIKEIQKAFEEMMSVFY